MHTLLRRFGIDTLGPLGAEDRATNAEFRLRLISARTSVTAPSGLRVAVVVLANAIPGRIVGHLTV